MDKPMWPRLGAASGILFVALLMGGDLVPVKDGILQLFGLILFIPFVGYLFSVLHRAEGGDGWLSATALGAGLIASAIKLSSGGQFNAAQGVQGINGTQIEEVLIAMDGGAFIVHLVPLGVMLAAASAVIIKTRCLPVWLGWAGALIACALLVNGALPDSEFALAFVFFMLWTVVTSAVLTRRVGKARVEASSDAGGMTKGGAEAG